MSEEKNELLQEELKNVSGGEKTYNSYQPDLSPIEQNDSDEANQNELDGRVVFHYFKCNTCGYSWNSPKVSDGKKCPDCTSTDIKRFN